MELEANFQTTALENLGLEQQTKRHIRAIDIICIGWNICNSWIGLGATLALSISLSGTVTLIYGILVIFVMLGASVLTMAELASVYPTAGGQYVPPSSYSERMILTLYRYHWTSILTPKRFSRVVVSTSESIISSTSTDDGRAMFAASSTSLHGQQSLLVSQ